MRPRKTALLALLLAIALAPFARADGDPEGPTPGPADPDQKLTCHSR